MTKKRDSDLKERMRALRVNEPLKLKSELVFKSPQAKSEVPQNGVPHSDQARSEHTQNEQPQLSPPKSVAEPESSGEAARYEQPRNEQSQIRQPQSEVPSPKPPDSEVAQRDMPQSEPPQKEAAGFFKLSHRVFFEPLLRDLSGDGFRLFLWLSSRAWRYPTSDGTVRASVGYIETQAGMSHATISRALKTLKEKKLVSIVEVDFKKGNLWQVSSIASIHATDIDPDRGPQTKGPQNEAPQPSREGASNRARTSLKARQPPPQNEEDLRSIKKNKKIKEAISIVFPVPLDTASDEVAGEEAVSAFESALASEHQQQIVSSFVEKEFPHGFFPPMRVIRAMAAKNWYRMAGPSHQVAI